MRGGSDYPVKRTLSLAALITVGLLVGLPVPAHADPAVTVVQVIDGDTFTIAGGQKVRVLGIDSCELGTEGGRRAKADAEQLLASGISLRAEPGAPDKDRYGRLLRYVDLPTSDFGMSMVSQPHTGVSAGKNDASRTYLAALRLTDSDGRTCTAPAPVLANPGDGNDHTYIPLPDRHRDRHHGGFHRPRLGGGKWWR